MTEDGTFEIKTQSCREKDGQKQCKVNGKYANVDDYAIFNSKSSEFAKDDYVYMLDDKIYRDYTVCTRNRDSEGNVFGICSIEGEMTEVQMFGYQNHRRRK